MERRYERNTVDDLIAEIQEKTGLSTEKVLEVLTMVTDFMKDQLPEDLVEQVASYLGAATEMASGAAGSASDAASSASSVASGAVDKAVGTAASVFSKAVDAVANVVAPDDDE
ncbi:MAG: hypothetical protein BMS9Abin17_1586 [Acidimicrobiia bacterium]|nr:MAG: hypothetical protein BMS9Abin17_1586 [Acidimicrobiia bacterium]